MEIKKQSSFAKATEDKSEDIEKIKKELEEIKKKAEEYLNNWKRVQADYINREKAIEKDKENWIKFANLNLILELLPLFDHFNHALNHIPDNEKNLEWVKGMSQIKKQFELLLKNFGVEKIKTIGEKFNPDCHEVIGKEKIKDNPSGIPLRGNSPEGRVIPRGKDIIIKEIQPGYKMHEVIIKPAKVIISE